MSRVDVFVPCYRYGRFLRQCVTSVLEQSLSDVRVLIVDDASPDDTPAVAAALAAEDPRVETRRHDVNRGVIATFNEGVEWAAADYMVLISADDFLLPGALERAATFLDDHPDVGFVFGPSVDYHTGGSILVPPVAVDEPEWRISEGIEFIRSVIPVNRVAAPTVMVRTVVQKQLGGYREDLPHTADLEMWMRFALHGRVGELNAYQAAYRRHPDSMSVTYWRRVVPDVDQRRAAFAAIFSNARASAFDCRQLEARAVRSLAEETLRAAHYAFERREFAICDDCIGYVIKLYPEIRSSRLWSRLMWKRRMGREAWALLAPIIRGLRARAGSPESRSR